MSAYATFASSNFSRTDPSKVYGCGRERVFTLADLVRDKTVTCIWKGTARYGWMVGICTMGYVGSVEINRWMVQQGGASPYLHYGGRICSSSASQVKSAGEDLYASTYQNSWDYRKNPGSPPTAENSRTNTVLPVPATISVTYVNCVAVRVLGKRPSCIANWGMYRNLTGTGRSGPASEMMV